MKKNGLELGILFLFAGMFGGCIDDRGNYSYLSENTVMPAEITLAKDTTLEVGNTYRLEASVKGDENVRNLRYMWYIYADNAVGAARGRRDTLGFGKKLDFTVNYDPGSYSLWFEVRDTVADVCTDEKMTVHITTWLTNVWLICKTIDGNMDVDAVLADGSLKENLLVATSQERLKGKALKIGHVSRLCHEEEQSDGTTTILYKKAFYLISEGDIRVCDAEQFGLLKDAASCFYEKPDRIRPSDIDCSSDVLLVNDGKLYALSNSSQNAGKFDCFKMGMDGTSNYRLSGGGIWNSYNTAVWDETSHSFGYFYIYDNNLTYFGSPSGNSALPAVKDMDVTLRRLMLQKEVYDPSTYSFAPRGYAVMQDGENNHYIAELSVSETSYPLKGYYRLPSDCTLGLADVMTPHINNPVIFYAKDGELWQHDVNDTQQDAFLRERKLYAFPGEKIAYLRHLQVYGTDIDALMVLTNSAGGWKLYHFPFIGGGSEFDMTVKPEDALIARGKGEASYVLRMNNGGGYY